jgi:hypothetical protein
MKRNLVGKIFGIGLVFVMIEMMPWYDQRVCEFEVKTVWI